MSLHREGEIQYDNPYMWNLKRNDTKELTKQKETHRLSQRKRTSFWLLGVGDRGEGIVRELWMDMYTLLYLKWITHKDVLCSTRNSAQCYVAPWMEGEFGGEGIHVHGWLSPFAVT